MEYQQLNRVTQHSITDAAVCCACAGLLIQSEITAMDVALSTTLLHELHGSANQTMRREAFIP